MEVGTWAGELWVNGWEESAVDDADADGRSKAEDWAVRMLMMMGHGRAHAGVLKMESVSAVWKGMRQSSDGSWEDEEEDTAGRERTFREVRGGAPQGGSED